MRSMWWMRAQKMKKNDSLKKIAELLTEAKTILLLTHMIPDGDTVGSAAALCHALRAAGKTAHILSGEALPDHLSFLKADCFIEEGELLSGYDLAVAVDCSDLGRLSGRDAYFARAGETVCVDHHKTNTFFADYNYIDPKAAATGEIIYRLLLEAGMEISKEAAEGLYVAIVTDTGQFQYSNTTSETHRIAADLFEKGIDQNEISIRLYQSLRKERLQVLTRCMERAEFILDGRAGFAYATEAMLHEISAEIQDTDGVIEAIRDVAGVEVAIFVKEIDHGVMKVGFRSKRDVDVAEIAAQFGGGGHAKAAGCTLYGTIEDVKGQIYPAVEKALDEN